MTAIRKKFESTLNQTYKIRVDENNAVEVKLTKIDRSDRSERFDCFTLMFEVAPGTPPLPDNTYLLEHEAFGKRPTFLSPTPLMDPRNPGHYYYEAVFNIFLEDEVPPESGAQKGES